MLNLIRKDLLLNRTVLVINAVIYTVCLIFMSSFGEDFPPMLFAGFGSLMIAFIPASLIAREDKFNALTLACSLPVKRRTIVRARFLMGLGTSALGILTIFSLVVILPFTHFGPGDLFAFGPLLTAATLTALVISFVLPFVLRFGMRGLMYFLVATQALGILLLTLTQLTGSSADRRLVHAVIAGFERAFELAGPWGFRALLLTALGVLLGLSYLISARFFENRDI